MHKNQLERKTVSVEELALSNAYQLEAMINVLKRKGIGRERSPRRTGTSAFDPKRSFATAQHWVNSITSKLKAVLVVNRDSISIRLSIGNKTRLPWVLARKTNKGK